MIKNLQYCVFISLFCALFIFQSCIRDIILDSHNKPKVVVECIMSTNSSEQQLFLSLTKGKSQEEYIVIEDAKVEIFDKSTSSNHIKFEYIVDNCWLAAFTPQPGHCYRLEIDIPGFDKIWSECNVPLDLEHFCIEGSVFYNVLSNYQPNTSIIPERSPSSLDLPSRYKYTNGICYRYSSDISSRVSLRLFYVDQVKGERVYANSLSTDLSCADHTLATEVLYEKSINCWTVSTIPNSFHDLWIATDYPSIIGNPIYDKEILFSTNNHNQQNDNLFVVSNNDPDFLEGIQNKGNSLNGPRYNAFLHATIFPEILREYELTLELYKEKLTSKDISSIFLRDNLPSNIHGGIGIFTVLHDQILPWEYKFSLYEKKSSNIN